VEFNRGGEAEGTEDASVEMWVVLRLRMAVMRVREVDVSYLGHWSMVSKTQKARRSRSLTSFVMTSVGDGVGKRPQG
jgi:hypothetical protein